MVFDLYIYASSLLLKFPGKDVHLPQTFKNISSSHSIMTSLNSNIIKKISAIVGKEYCTTRMADLHCYSYDGKGIIYLPEAVAFPRTTEEVSEIMKLASLHRFAVVPRGAGTGMTGGSLPIAGGLVMAMTRMNSIVEIDHRNQVAVVEPGVITIDLQKAVQAVGLFYPPDPASLKFCTVGGNAAECAGGPSAVKYGVTKDYIMGLEAVLPSGEIVTAGTRTEKGVTGYDLTRLFVGSEGTLGIITKLYCRLLPLPESKATFLVLSKSLDKATELVSTILNRGIVPSTLEYMDRTAIRIVSDLLSEPPAKGTEALLLLELDGTQKSIDEQTVRLRQLLADDDDISFRQAKNEAEVKELWLARRSISPAAFKLKPHKISEDVAVPRSRIPELVRFTEKLSQELDITILTFGHAGDGNIHVNIMIDKANANELERGEKAKELLFVHTISLEGTLSGEHGIGITKSAYLGLELNEATIKLMKSIKSVMDPHNILNPGKIFPETIESGDK
ncbi:probable glycolate oxidase subunit (GlcD) [Desulfotalea psychrophila LSv54]|uniref:Probable glycolate oxidase subunit (GlcD) n=1 Tax=Desulfotalea psychrophila (strain LSv54 / DSM 12343) TaxID=177439 RepID=Q6ASD7_DESPS|nr:probable glycolate oxidase subunit (GlcD) [Desulfotalea psychrophila LSv54]